MEIAPTPPVRQSWRIHFDSLVESYWSHPMAPRRNGIRFSAACGALKLWIMSDREGGTSIIDPNNTLNTFYTIIRGQQVFMMSPSTIHKLFQSRKARCLR
jgi:hypothetical protein